MTATMPAVFFGHGSPMNTLERNRHTDAWRAFGRAAPRPSAILAVSAHWYVRESAVTAMPVPKTIHDFGGFPPALHAFQYPARGDPTLAARVREMLAPVEVRMDDAWGLDHGTWSVLAHVYPDADVPVVQFALDRTRPAAFHYEMGHRLAPLRDEGVMIVASGNIVHNLGVIQWSAGAAPYPWAAQFNDAVREQLGRGEHAPLVAYETLGEAARMSVPTPEHYLPALYVMGAQRGDDALTIVADGIELGSISMLSFSYNRQSSLPAS